MKLIDKVLISDDFLWINENGDLKNCKGMEMPIYKVLSIILSNINISNFVELTKNKKLEKETEENNFFIEKMIGLYKGGNKVLDLYNRFTGDFEKLFKIWFDKLSTSEGDLFLAAIISIIKEQNEGYKHLFIKYDVNENVKKQDFYKDLQDLDLSLKAVKFMSGVFSLLVNANPLFFHNITLNENDYVKSFGLKNIQLFRNILWIVNLVKSNGVELKIEKNEEDFMRAGIKDFIDSFYDNERSLSSIENIAICVKTLKESKSEESQKIYNDFLNLPKFIVEDNLDSSILKKSIVLDVFGHLRCSIKECKDINNLYIRNLIKVEDGVINLNINTLVFFSELRVVNIDLNANLKLNLPVIKKDLNDLSLYKKVSKFINQLSENQSDFNNLKEDILNDILKIVLKGGISHSFNALLLSGCFKEENVQLVSDNEAYILKIPTNLKNLDKKIFIFIMTLMLETKNKVNIEKFIDDFQKDIMKSEIETGLKLKNKTKVNKF